MLAQPAQDPQLPVSVVLTATDGELHLGSSQCQSVWRNLSAHPIDIPTQAIIGKVILSNQVLLVVLPKETLGGSAHVPQKGWILEALNLQGLKEWHKVEQEEAKELLLKWEHLFTHSDLDLGKTSFIKHWIKLTDLTPFKKHYQCIPPHMYNNMKAHLQQMLDIGAIRKFTQSMG